VRLADLPRTTSFRLALLFLLLFGAASLLLFGFLYRETNGYLTGMLDNWLYREQNGFAEMEQRSFLDRIRAHVMADPGWERPFSLFDPTGRLIAGTPLELSPTFLPNAPLDRPFEFTLRQNGRDLHFRGMLRRVLSGELLLIAQGTGDAIRFNEVLIHALLLGGLATGLLGLAGAAITGADAVRRIDAVTTATRRIVNGDLSQRLPSKGGSSDLDRLVQVINGMLEEIEHLMQEVKGVCDNIAHDLRTPLTRLLAGLERAHRRAQTSEEYAAAVEDAIIETKALLRTFAAMLRISEVESGARRAGFSSVELEHVVADAVEFYVPMAEDKRITLEFQPLATATVMRGDSSLLFEAVANLVDNAIKFTPSGGRVLVRTFAELGRLGVEISDNGPGIPDEERESVSRRFYRTEESRNAPGTGLGLALVAAVARLHDMELVIADARPGCRISLVRSVASTGEQASRLRHSSADSVREFTAND
jgi:signal transduction histidine kinase